MVNTSDRPIYVDGVRLDTLAWNLTAINRQSAGRRSADANVPGMDGVIPSLNDDLEPARLGLDMFVRGTDRDGRVPANVTAGQEFRDNLDDLVGLFGKRHALLEVTQQVGPGSDERNLAFNPSMEAADALTTLFVNEATNPLPNAATGWSAVNGATIAYDAAAGGGAGIRVTMAAGGNTTAGVAVPVGTAVVVGDVRVYSVEFRAVLAGTYRLRLQNTVTPNPIDQAYAFNAGETKRLQIVVTHTSAGTPSLFALRTSTDAGEFIVRKAMRLSQPLAPTLVPDAATVVDYFDGATREGYWNDPDFTVAWQGTANLSASSLRAYPIALPTAVTGAGPAWVAFTGTGGSVQSNLGYVIRSTKWAKVGTYSARIIGAMTSAPAESYLRWNLNAAADGATFTAQLTMHLEAPQAGSLSPNARRLVMSGQDGNYYDSVLADRVPNLAGDYDRAITFTSGGTTRRFYIFAGATFGNGDVWVDALLVTRDQGTTTYFDGATVNDTQYTYTWEGAANASTTLRSVRAKRRALCKVTDAITPEVNLPGSAGSFTVGLEIPSGVWEDYEATAATLGAAVTSGQVLEVTNLRGTMERVNDAIILVNGPVAAGVRLTDPTTGAWVQLDQALGSTTRWRLNMATWTSHYGIGISYLTDDAAFTKALAQTTWGGMENGASFLPLTPVRGPDGVRRVYVVLTGTGFSAATTVYCQARRKYALP